jgi:hypothetical protein
VEGGSDDAIHPFPVWPNGLLVDCDRARIRATGGSHKGDRFREGLNLSYDRDLPDGQISHLVSHLAVQPLLQKYFVFT